MGCLRWVWVEDDKIVKNLLMLLLLMTAGLGQLVIPPSIPISQIMKLCQQTQGTWNSTKLACDCPVNYKFDQELGCYNIMAEDLCKMTNGVWFIDNLKVPPVGSCDCGFARKWSDGEGCYGGIIETILEFIRSLVPSYLFGK